MTRHALLKPRRPLARLLAGALIAATAVIAGPGLAARMSPPPAISFETWHFQDDFNNMSSWFIVANDQNQDGDVDFMGLANSGGGNALMFMESGGAQGYMRPDGKPRLFTGNQGFGRQRVKFWDANNDGHSGYVATDAGVGLVYRDRTPSGLDAAGEQQLQVQWCAACDGFGGPRFGQLTHMDTGDINGDGFTDVVTIGNRFNPNVRVFYNQGGSLVAGAVIPYMGGNWDGSGVRLADFNGDGRLDIVFSKLVDGSSPPAVYNVFRNNGDGTFTGFSLPKNLSALGLAIGDVNGDGRPDFFVSAFAETIGGSWIPGTRGIYLFTNTGTAGNISFAVSRVANIDDNHYPVALDAGDLNGDGFADMVYGVSNGDASQSQHPEAWAGDGTGNFTLAWTDTGANVVVDSMTIIEYNGRPAIAGGGYRGAWLFANFSAAPPSDTVAPVITVSGSVTAEASGPGGAAVTYSASANDANDGDVAVSCLPASGSTFGLGTTTVNCSATDAAANTATSSFDVTIVDSTAPSLSLPSAMTVAATSAAGATVSYSASASDLVSGGVAATCSPASGSTFALGTTTVNCSATDGAGNSSTGSFDVTVADETAPVVTALLVNISNGGSDNSMQFFRVQLSATDAIGVSVLTADLNGIRVTDGQIVQLQVKSGAQSAKRTDGKLQIQASSFLLTATGTDAAGNSATVTGGAVFNSNNKNR